MTCEGSLQMYRILVMSFNISKSRNSLCSQPDIPPVILLESNPCIIAVPFAEALLDSAV